jgi:hypothetical protein
MSPSTRPYLSFALSQPSRSLSPQRRPLCCSVVPPSSPGLCRRLGHGELHRSLVHREPAVVFPPTNPSAWSTLNLSPEQVGVCHHRGFSLSGQPESPSTVPSCPEHRLWVSNLPPPFFCTSFVSSWVILARRSRLSSGRRVLMAYDRYSPSTSPNLGVGHSYPLTEAHASFNAPDCPLPMGIACRSGLWSA